MDFTITVLSGDGVGPEVVGQGVKILKTVGQRFNHNFVFKEGIVGGIAIDQTGSALPAETLELCRKSDAVLLGAVGGPKWDDPLAKVRPEDGLLGLRKGLGLFANLRPVKVSPFLIGASPLKSSILQGVDLVVVRELTGGLYFAKPKRRWRTAHGRRAVDTLFYSEHEVRRIVQVGLELARGRRKCLTSVDKANILESSRLWREVASEVGKEYSDVTLDNMLVDTCAMNLVRDPRRFDVIVTENMFGDILTDEAAVLAGSMGMLPSASLAGVPKDGQRAFGLYEPIHGSAPDIAGQDRANPIATILSVAFLLRYSLDLSKEAAAVEKAVERALEKGLRTRDIAMSGEKTVGTTEMGGAIASLI